MNQPCTVITVFLMLACSMATADVGTNDLKEIRDLTRAGRYAEALERHLWFHEESESAVGMGGVRLSFALADWLKLTELYPPARDALVSLKDEDKALLLAGNGDAGNFRDLVAITNRSGNYVR